MSFLKKVVETQTQMADLLKFVTFFNLTKEQQLRHFSYNLKSKKDKPYVSDVKIPSRTSTIRQKEQHSLNQKSQDFKKIHKLDCDPNIKQLQLLLHQPHLFAMSHNSNDGNSKHNIKHTKCTQIKTDSPILTRCLCLAPLKYRSW